MEIHATSQYWSCSASQEKASDKQTQLTLCHIAGYCMVLYSIAWIMLIVYPFKPIEGCCKDNDNAREKTGMMIIIIRQKG